MRSLDLLHYEVSRSANPPADQVNRAWLPYPLLQRTMRTNRFRPTGAPRFTPSIRYLIYIRNPKALTPFNPLLSHTIRQWWVYSNPLRKYGCYWCPLHRSLTTTKEVSTTFDITVGTCFSKVWSLPFVGKQKNNSQLKQWLQQFVTIRPDLSIWRVSNDGLEDFGTF